MSATVHGVVASTGGAFKSTGTLGAVINGSEGNFINSFDNCVKLNSPLSTMVTTVVGTTAGTDTTAGTSTSASTDLGTSTTDGTASGTSTTADTSAAAGTSASTAAGASTTEDYYDAAAEACCTTEPDHVNASIHDYAEGGRVLVACSKEVVPMVVGEADLPAVEWADSNPLYYSPTQSCIGVEHYYTPNSTADSSCWCSGAYEDSDSCDHEQSRVYEVPDGCVVSECTVLHESDGHLQQLNEAVSDLTGERSPFDEYVNTAASGHELIYNSFTTANTSNTAAASTTSTTAAASTASTDTAASTTST
eukprot:Lankesteria_metandrocarpae@DN8953_c0_g1_i1.p1